MAADVSSVIPARNEGALLPTTVASAARARTDPRREVVIGDDGSAPTAWRQPQATCRPAADPAAQRGGGGGALACWRRGNDWFCERFGLTDWN